MRKLLSAVVGLGFLLCGCIKPGPPSKVEQILFVVRTNITEEVVVVTNQVQQLAIRQVVVVRTNWVQATNYYLVTNLVHRTQTNFVEVPVTVTNVVTDYQYFPGSGERVTKTVGSTATNLYAPGMGVVAGAGLTVLFTVWRKRRSGKTTKRKS